MNAFQRGPGSAHRWRLASIVTAICLLTCAQWCAARGPQAAAAASATAPGPLRVVYFDSATCPECRKVRQGLGEILRPWGLRVRLEIRDVGEAEALEELFGYGDHYGLEIEAPPIVFVGRRALSTAEEIREELNDIIARELEAGSVTFVPDSGSNDSDATRTTPRVILERFGGFKAGAVALAGLVDGVNPCAFTTIVFLLAMLTHLGKSRRELALVGAGFTAAVFVTYLLLGFGLLTAIKAFSVSHGLSVGLAYAVGFLALGLAAWSLVDFVRYVRTRDAGTLTLGLPRAVKNRIHAVIRTGLKTRGLLLGSLGVGFVVAILESLCTGQLYLPTIVLVAREPGMRASAVWFLLLYNVMFILPLVGILVVAYLGVRSEALGKFLQRHLAVLKLALALLFAALGVLVIATA